jgi:hypothetical protein
MGATAMAALIVSGKEDAWAEFAGSQTTGRGCRRIPTAAAWSSSLPRGRGPRRSWGEFATSENEFDKWFTERVAEVHGFDFSAPPPPPAERKINSIREPTISRIPTGVVEASSLF